MVFHYNGNNMGSITKITTNSIKDGEVKTADINDSAVTTAKLADDAVTSAKINDGVVSGDDLSSTLDLSSKTLTLANTAFNTQHFNVALLGFKMAVNDSLTVFNLVDGIVDEFHDESGADEGEGSNDLYNATDDYYINSTQPDGSSLAYSAGFGINNITEPTTSTAGTNPDGGSGTFGTFTVPTGVTSVDIIAFGAGGGNGANPPGSPSYVGAGAPGGYAEGTLAVTASQVLYAYGGEGGNESGSAHDAFGVAMGGKSPNSTAPPGNQFGGGGGAAAGVVGYGSFPGKSQPQVYVMAGGGGGSTLTSPQAARNGSGGGAGGGLVGNAGGPDGDIAQTNNTIGGAGNESSGGGGSQTAGGQQGSHPTIYCGQAGSFLGGGKGADTPQGTAGAGGGSGFYGGGGGGGAVTAPTQNRGHGGGGSSYYGHPQITSGATTAGSINDSGEEGEGGGVTQPGYSPGTNDGGARPTGSGQDGFILLTAAASATATSTTIVSNAFTASSAPSTSRIVVFQENVDSITLNTDLIASVSRDGGSNFSTVTLADEGYVTGSSGQRILAGVVDISGQPSGTSLRWKLALANNQSKVHGVSLSWA